MKRVKEDFDKRKGELEKYFYFLSLLDKDDPKLSYSEKGISYTYAADSELVKILKANGFLLIYNLVESFCRNFIIEILTEIHNGKLSVKRLSKEARKIWIAQKVRNLRDPKVSDKKLEDGLGDIAIDIFDNVVVEFSEVVSNIENNPKFDAFGLSGSIDKKKIRSLATQYGFDAPTSEDEEKCGAILEEVKDSRNRLAHGRITFAECGKDQTVPGMIRYKDQAIEYLESVLLNIEVYLKEKKFKEISTRRRIR